ncbi:hypothetical protein AA984_25065 [Brevibacillus formosus]|uniref:Uncharacterized protein n=1 Tax=Brevibacillus formosus TaxID=54913 RepID=A0A837KJ97_9BACL|nr:hypothetical protein AA984_25065 [Brevibacillus formosus]PSJ94433.1 hypothetical protein C7R91_17105 [Brevibacillus formosus]
MCVKRKDSQGILQLDKHEPSKSMRLIKKGAILFDSMKMNVHNNWKRAYNQNHNHDAAKHIRPSSEILGSGGTNLLGLILSDQEG